MNLFVVSFFGHRQVDDPFLIERQLESIIRELLLTKEYIEFLVGRDGEFDQLVSSTVRRCKRTIRDDNSSLVLVLPYMTAEYRNNEESFHEYYDEIEICLESAEKHFKSAHQVRNRSMVDRSDLVIFCMNGYVIHILHGECVESQLYEVGQAVCHIFRQKPAVGTGISDQFLFIEILRVVQGLLCRVATHTVGFSL